MYSRAWLAGGVAKVVLSQYAGRNPTAGRWPSATPIHRADQSASDSRPASSATGSLHSLSPWSVHTLTRAAAERTDLPEDLRGPLAAACDKTVAEASFPYGAHVCEVEVDAETGVVKIVHYAAVDDVGRAVNPLIIHGQVHGGIAQGVGQALLEHCHYDAETGQLLAASFMDYAMPRASDLPFYVTELSEVPSTTHPLGIRPAGEGGTVPALAVIINAVGDALWDLGVRHVEMPATPSRIWQAIVAAKARRQCDGPHC